ncbi:MAG: flagellar basal body L-ring protein FlgH [Plesiomonas sp.]|uniref:flagellar basal body L-ring protein FlgH n=2 Tax=Plesiomonas sp. TaxID=2486279 RepID=UPI003F3BAEB7
MKRVLVMMTLLLLAGCAHPPIGPYPGEDNFTPPPMKLPAMERDQDGGLFSNDYNMALFQDRRAFRVGDVLTVVLQEQTSSSKRAGTSFGKESNASVGVATLFGKEYPKAASSLGADRDFKGNSTSSQQNSLSGSITVLVYEVMPNGILRVRGEKWLRLNQGDEYIRLNGLVRVDDIDGSNRVPSQRLADARITYSGRGALSDSNSAGWLTRFFNSPFFPI